MALATAGLRALAAATITSLGMVASATAGVVSDYDARIEADFSFVIAPPGGLFAITPLFPQFSHSETGDAVFDQDGNDVGEGPPGPGPFSAVLDLHVSGTGTGSSSADGSISFTIGPPVPPVQPGFVTPDAVDAFIFIVHQNELVTTNTFNSAPGGIAISSFTFGGPTPVGGGVMQVACATAGFTAQAADACYSATGTVTVTLSGTVSGEAVTPSVPEPATLALLGVGLAGLAASRRRKLN